MNAALKTRLIRYAAVALIALAVAQGVRAFQGAALTVPISYDVPPGELRVTIRDANDNVVRTAWFSATERQHMVELPPGQYTARLERGGEGRARAFEVRDEGAIQLRWW